ncbi:MAG: filamentous hemagglutinin N-terminal domain-containing protein [Candidatus Eremiobacteraeota bacterium]|nr:filamentous hemagglutinin N-terminal domain-containing protein [Candidatus Eremiobacteraeota bacterium]
MLGMLTGAALALPEGASVTGGSVNINTNGNTQTIQQLSDRAIINWNGFNIDIGELVHFVQPSSLSAILNRVVGQDPSMILGAMQANGQVFLINPNGVIFGQSANIDVGSLVVSTLNITDQDFMAGRLTFQQEADKDLAAVINHGTIKINDNGFLVLTGPMVANDGVILARVGQVAMAAGTKTTVSFDPTGMIQVELPTDANTADGIVSLSQEDAGNILSSVVNTPQVQAGEIVVRDGRTFLEAQSGTLVNAGVIRADGVDGTDAGRIVLNSTSNTILGENSVTSAAGSGSNSSGGEVYVLSDGVGVSELGSLIDVSDGGFAEQSSNSGYVGATVNTGEAGTFLIDPERIVVQTGAGGGIAPTGIVYRPENAIESRASGTELLETEDGVDFEALNGGALTLMNNVDLEINLTSSAGNNGAAVTFANTSDRIVLQGTGSFFLTNPASTNAENLKVETDSGLIGIYLDGGGALTGDSRLTSKNGSIEADVTGDLFIVSDSSSSTDALDLGFITADRIFATGDDFVVNGAVDATTLLSIIATGNIERGEGELVAPTLNLQADRIGEMERIPFSAQDLTVSANSINLDNAGLYSLTNIDATNMNALDPFTAITIGGEGSYIVDANGTLRADAGGTIVYNFTGDRNLGSAFFPQNITLNTSGSTTNDITGFFPGGGDITIVADSIELEIDSFGILGTLTGTANNGDITISDFSGNPLDVNLTASGDVFVNEESNSALLTGFADGNYVVLGGDSVGEAESPFLLGPNVELLDVYFQDEAFILGNSPSIEVYAEDSFFSEGTTFLGIKNDGGSLVGDYIFADEVYLEASGSLQGFAGGGLLTLQAASIDMTASADEVDAAATNDINLDIESPFGRFGPSSVKVSAISQSGDVTITELLGEGEGQGQGQGQGQGIPGGGILTGQIEGDNITITADSSFILTAGTEPDSQLVGQNITLTAGAGIGRGEGPAIFANVNTPNLVANADGRVEIYSFGQNLNMASNSDNVIIEAVNVNAVLSDAIFIDASGTGNVSVESQAGFTEFVSIQAGNTASFTTPASAGPLQSFQGTNLILDVGGDLDRSLSAPGFVQVTADSVALDVTASQVTATARTGDVSLTGTNSNIGVAANSQNGDVTVNMNGNITHNAISGDNVSVTANGGSITQGTGRVTGSTVSLTGNNVSAQTATGNLTVNVGGAGNATIANQSANLSTNISTTGNVNVSNTGALGGTYAANNLKLAGQSVNANISANTVEGDATAGNVALNSSGTNELMVTNSSAPNGSFTLNHNGDVVFDTINAQNVTINTTGDITDVANTIIAQGITLNGNNILINTQGQVIVINAQGNVGITNTVVDVSSLTIDAQGNVSFGTTGNLAIAQVAGGQLVQLTAGGNISGNPGAFVNGFDVEVLAGGTITPDLNSPLQIGATNSILLQAQGVSIAGALQGQLPADAVTIQTPSGPIYYNGILLNGAPVEVPPTVPTGLNEVIDQIGQQNGQVVDDGSVGSAANDGLVEESPTQKLVAQLTEAAGGSGGGGATTEVLITLEIDQLGEVQVELTQPSPFDQAIDGNENMSADDVLDLDTEELTEVEVSLYYDAANDQIIMAVNLSADDVLDLDVSEFELIPVSVTYQITGDPALMIEKLRANDIIDLQVEELGEIPIKVHVSGGEDVSSDE